MPGPGMQAAPCDLDIALGDVVVSGNTRDLQRMAVKRLFRVVQHRHNRSLIHAFARWQALTEAPINRGIVPAGASSMDDPTVFAPIQSRQAAFDFMALSPPPKQRGRSGRPGDGPTCFVTLPERMPTSSNMRIGPTSVPITEKTSAFSLLNAVVGCEHTKPSGLFAAMAGVMRSPGHGSRRQAVTGQSSWNSTLRPGVTDGIRGRFAALDTARPVPSSFSAALELAACGMPAGPNSGSGSITLGTVSAAVSCLQPLDIRRTPLSPMPSPRVALSSTSRAPSTQATSQSTAVASKPPSGAFSSQPTTTSAASANNENAQPTTTLGAGPMGGGIGRDTSASASGRESSSGKGPLANMLRARMQAGVVEKQGKPPLLVQEPLPVPIQRESSPRPALRSLPQPTTAMVAATASVTPIPEALRGYAKMLEVGVPEVAVKARMAADGVKGSPSMLRGGTVSKPQENVSSPLRASTSSPLAVPVPASTAVAAGASTSTPQGTEAHATPVPTHLSKYARMLAMGVPPVAVEGRMRTDGCSPTDVALIVPPAPSSGVGTSALPTSPPLLLRSGRVSGRPSIGSPLKRTSGVGIGGARAFSSPPSQSSGTSTSTSSSSNGGSEGVGVSAVVPAVAKARGPPKRLHWKELPSSAVVSDTVWDVSSSEQAMLLPTDLISDLRMMFFAQEAPSVPGTSTKKRTSLGPSVRCRDRSLPANSRRSESGEESLTPLVSLIDQRRAGNISITLSKFVSITFDQIMVALHTLDVGKAGMSEDAARSILAVVPTDQERDLLHKFAEEHGGSSLHSLTPEAVQAVASRLSRPDMWLLMVSAQPRFTQRARCLNISWELAGLRHSVVSKAQQLTAAEEQLRASPAFRTLLLIVLHVGNALNSGGLPPEHHAAKGFSLDSLSKLSGVKSYDKRSSALAFVVEGWIRAHTMQQGNDSMHSTAAGGGVSTCACEPPSLLAALKEECTAFQKAVAVSYDAVEADAKLLRNQARQVAAEVAAVATQDSVTGGNSCTSCTIPVDVVAYEALHRDALAAAIAGEETLAACKAGHATTLQYFGVDASVYPSPDVLVKDMAAFFNDIATIEGDIRGKLSRAAKAASGASRGTVTPAGTPARS